MSRKSSLLIMVFMLLCLAIAPGQQTSAKEADGFVLSVAEAGDRIDVTVTLNDAKDMYAYDLVLKFDPVRLAYKDAKLSLPGFAVKPKLSRGELRLAHTRVGETPGRNGMLELAVVGFQRIRGGDTFVKLESVRLVDSKLEKEELAPNSNMILRSGVVAKLPADVAGHWSEEAVREAMELGFVSGFGDGTFRPDEPVTRLEATVLLGKALLVSEAGESEISFTDVGVIPLWGLPYVGEAARSGWLNGYGDGTFRGGKPIARQEFATIIARAMDASATGNAAVLSAFGDRHLLAPWAAGPTALAVERGILQGQGGGLLNPAATTTRAEAVTMILRLLASGG